MSPTEILQLQEQSKLYPCPFCGSNDLFIGTRVRILGYYAACSDCRTRSAVKETPIAAREAWNTRVSINNLSVIYLPTTQL